MGDTRESKMKAADELEREDEALQSGDQSSADLDQTHADSDQTHADSDQSAADADQEVSDTDQGLSDRDQHASDKDQAAADSEGAGSSEGMKSTARVERFKATRERAQTSADRARVTERRLITAEARDVTAGARDLTAAARDRTAQARDRAADARDRAAEARQRHAAEAYDLVEAIGTLHTIRVSGASTRKQSAQERDAAAEDRTAAAADRQHAAADRGDAGLDELTGVFRRGTGEHALVHEIERSRRAGHPLILLVVDIDGLKLVNDVGGHAAGDTLVRAVPTAITATLRSYDVTVRWGGDEFVCALPKMTRAGATDRVSQIRRELELLQPGATICVGLAELREDDSLESLVARADADLYRAKASRGSATEAPHEAGRS